MSYRSYVPWKTNLPSYKSSSTYSSRDDITGSDGKAIPKFGSITSPAAYRPSYSGGTYRSVPIKRDPPLSTYVSRYSSNTIDSSSSQSKDDKNKATDTITKKIQKPTTVSSTTKYTPLSTTKEVNETPSTPTSSRLSTSSGNLSRYSRSRDPSPSVESRSRLLTPSKVKSREPSPARSTLRARSRDPSPADITLRSKLTSPVNSYASSYRLCPRSSSGYSSRYGSNNSLGRSPIANGALSYMSSSDMRARSINQQQEHIEHESLQQNKDIKEEELSKSETEETEEEDNSNDSKATVPVTVITRGTSPTPPGSSSVTRTRRIDIAKTIEKIIHRPVKKHKCVDKEIQSDRLDDSTRYSRFGATSRVSSIPWTPYTDSKLASNLRYSSSSSKNSRDSTSTSKSEQDSNERKRDDSGSAISRNSSLRSSTKKEKSKNKNTITTSSTSTTTGSAEVYQIPGPKTLPPTIPKTESPTKTISSSSGNLKLPNKDFRKSSLNVGPTDRPRKSRTPSTSTDSEEKNEQTAQNIVHTNERSPSVGSETSATSSSSSSANNASKRCHQPKIRTSSSNISTQMKSFSEDNSSIAVTNEASISSSGIGNSNSKFYNKNDRDIVNIRNKQLYQQQISPKYLQTSSKQQISTATNSNNQADDSSSVSKNEGAKTYLLRKLGSVSNFFVTRSQDTSGEMIYLDKSSSSTSNDLKQNGTIATTTASEQFIPVTTATQTNNSKTETSELDDSSWWLNTSQQIDTESALDIKDEMKFKIRHIDSGEIAWWMRNDDEDETIAEDIKTYDQDEQNEFADNSQNTENLISPDQSWWTNENESKSEKYKIRRNDSGEQAWWLNDNEAPSISTNSQARDTYSGEQPLRVSTDSSDKQKQQIESINQRSSSNENNSKNRSQDETTIDDSIWSRKSSPDKKQNSLESRTKIYRVDSGEKPWWMDNKDDDETFVKNYDSPSKKENSQSPEKKSTSFAKIHRVDSNEKAWWLTEDNSNNENYSENTEIHQNSDRTQSQHNSRNTPSGDKPWWMAGPAKKSFQIRHIDSGEKAWWLQDDPSEKADDKNCEKSEDSEVENVIVGNLNNSKTTDNEDSLRPPLGDRASPEGLEDPSAKRNKSPYDNCLTSTKKSSENTVGIINNDTQQNTQHLKKLFISRHTNIDELLGGSCRPLSPILDRFNGKNKFLEEITPAQVRIHDSTAQMPVIQRMERDNWTSENISVSSTSSSVQQQKQKSSAFTYELDDAALQVYKDGDFGAYLDLESSLAEQSEDIEGLNSSRKNSLVVRTQLSVRVHAIIEKLLSSEGSELRRALFSLKQIFQEDKDLVHGFVALGGLKCLVRVGNVADQNYQNYILRALGQVMLYVDGMNGVMKHGPTIQWLYSLIASKYRLVVKTALKLLLVFVEYVESNCYLLVNAIHAVDNSQGTLPWSNIMKLLKDYENADTELLIYATSLINKTLSGLSDQDSFYDESDFLEQQGMEGVIQRYMSRPGTDLDLLDQLQLYEAVLKFEDGETDGIRLPDNSVRKTLRYRPSTDSAERRKSRRHSTGTSPQIQSQMQNSTPTKRYTPLANQGVLDEDSSSSNNSNEFSGGVFRECKGKREGAGVTPGLRRRRERAERQKTFMKEQQEALANGGIKSPFDRKDELNGLESDNEDKRLLLQLKRDHTVKDLTQKLTNLPPSPQEDKSQNRIGDMTGLISKAKEGLAKSKSKGEISRSPSVDQDIKKSETKKSENEVHWEELVKNISRPLTLCDLDFTDLNSDDEKDVLAPRGLGGNIPPPPPPIIGMPPPPMMISGMMYPPTSSTNLPPPPTNLVPPPVFNYGNMNSSSTLPRSNNSATTTATDNTIKKNKKTVKLFWKEVREDMIPPSIGKTIWDELPSTNVDIQKLEHLFESRAKDLMTKEKQQELNKNKEIIVLDHKRSNAINIAMTKLPPPRAIKAAILKMDATVVTREGIDKLLNMLPTDEERGKIQEAQMSNPELPLGSAEQFLLTLSSISELAARLKLWAFKLDFENSEKEIAEPLMDLKQGIELLRVNKTFKCILATLLSVGIFLNGIPVKGFQIEYLAKVPEVKDTVHKHSLLHHLCHMVMESSPDTTDLYSEIGPITRASKADFTELAHNLIQLETECKASWDRLKLIAKHDCPPQLKQKLVDFLADCAERIIILQIVHRRVINRYRKFLLWLGVPQHRVAESKPNEFCRILSEFALEYRTTRERVHQQMEKKANHRERNKTRGKMIIDIGKFRTQEDRADAELKQLLGSPNPGTQSPDGTLTWRRRRADNLRSPLIKPNADENFTDGDDEILESLVKTATKAPGTRTTPRERKRTRHADRKSLKRSRTREGLFTVDRAAASLDH